MIGKFKLANRFATVNTKVVYENVFYDRFNSIFKGFYLVISEQQLSETLKSGGRITFIKIPSTECFGSQDVTEVELCNLNLITPEQKKMIIVLNSAISSNNYNTVGEKI